MSKLAETIITAIQDKKGHNIVSLDLTGIDGAIADTFVICNADSTTQVGAIAEGISKDVKDKTGERVWRTEGMTNSIWVVMDYGDVMVHIFQTEMREFYKLEEVWAEAPLSKYESEE